MDDKNLHIKHKEKIKSMMTSEPFSTYLGIELLDIGEGSATAHLIVTDEMLNAHGTVHGGVVFSLADFVFEAACKSYGRSAVGLSSTVHFMAAANKNSKLIAYAIEEKRNNRIAWYKVRVECETELIATMEGTAYLQNHYFVPTD